MNKQNQIYWEDVKVKDNVPAISFPLSIYRLVMEAGVNRDFNSIHHNTEYARADGAPDMYANTVFLQGMWERTVREYIGLAGKIKSFKGFTMKVFNTVGDTVVTKGLVKNKWLEEEEGLVELEIWCENSQGISVGPGSVIVTLPKKSS